MKNTIKLIGVILFFSLGYMSCEKGEGLDDYGLAYIYMPQATISGGLNNNYYVPSGDGPYTYNFKIDASKKELQILLGVLRSGDLSNAGFSVDVIARTDTTNQIIAAGLVENGVIFPQNGYSLPQKVMVSDDKNAESFYLTVPFDVLKSDVYTDKKMVMTVAIANPSKFELSAVNTNTVVIVDVNAIREHIE
jgi:hypothetical protein